MMAAIVSANHLSTGGDEGESGGDEGGGEGGGEFGGATEAKTTIVKARRTRSMTEEC